MQVAIIAATAMGLVGLARLLAVLEGTRPNPLPIGVRHFAPEDVREISHVLARVNAMYRNYRSPGAGSEGRRLIDLAVEGEWDIESIATDDCPALGRHTFIRFGNGRVFRLSGAEAAEDGQIGTLTPYPEELLGSVPLMHPVGVHDEPSGITIAFEGPTTRIVVTADSIVAVA